MKRENELYKSPDEALTEETIEIIRKKLKKARKKYVEAYQAQYEVFEALEAACIDDRAPSSAPYTENLLAAIQGYTEDGDNTLKYIIDDIRREYERGSGRR